MFRRLIPIILVTFVNVVGFSVLFPVLPTIAERYGPQEYRGILYGALVSSYAGCQFLAAPILGSLSDKYGRKPILLLSQLGTTLSWVVFGLAYFLPQDIQVHGFALPLFVIAFSRVIDGVTGGNISVAQAWISDASSKEEKTKAFSLMGATFGAGFLIGPALGGITSATSIGYLGTAIFSVCLSVVTLLAIRFLLPESLTEENRDHELHIHFWNDINVFRKIWLFRENQFVYYLLIMRLFFALVFASVTTLLVLILEQHYSLSPVQLGLVLSLMGVFSVLNQTFIVHRVAGTLGDLHTVYTSFGLLFFVMCVIGGVDMSLWLFVGMIFILMIGTSLGMPTFKSILTSYAHPKRQGMITGVDESLLSLGQAVTPVVAGGLYTVIGSKTLLLYAGLLLIPHVLIWMITGRPILKD